MKKNKRLNLSMTDELFNEISANAEKHNISLSAYCIQAIEKNLGKVQKIDPKTITIDPVSIYTDDVREALNKIGNTAAKLDRTLYTLSQKNTVSEFELKRIAELTNQLKEEEKAFNNHMETVYEERAKLRKDILKKIESTITKLLKR
ncbi:MAG: hypothetical protein UIM53_05945 [Acutalibacteraceae bacterium]|nr:hypothetical protein [Acutalibacteraceae bacterium]